MVEATFGNSAAAALQGSGFAIETINGGTNWECGNQVSLTPATAQVLAKYMPSNCK